MLVLILGLHIYGSAQHHFILPFIRQTTSAFFACLLRDTLALCRFAGKYEGLVSEVPSLDKTDNQRMCCLLTESRSGTVQVCWQV